MRMFVANVDLSKLLCSYNPADLQALLPPQQQQKQEADDSGGPKSEAQPSSSSSSSSSTSSRATRTMSMLEVMGEQEDVVMGGADQDTITVAAEE